MKFINYLFPLLFVVEENKDADYYTELWNENQLKAEKYVRPIRNEEFGEIEDFCGDLDQTFDFIIVGGGSAGSVLANRLSEITNWNILLIEAGGNETDFSLIPAAFFTTHLLGMNWGYLTEPQENVCFGNVDHRCDFVRGKVLGGSSSINAMIHVRGNPSDFDNWAEMGNDGWSYEEVLPYFKKCERIYFKGNSNFHGYSGPLKITESSSSFEENVINGNIELGLPEVDYNGKRQFGVSRIQRNIFKGKRNSVNQAYLQPVLNRNNLKVITEALVYKINFEKNVAKSVLFLKDNECFEAKANKEIIISGGSVNSPQLLMLSGIGPREELSKHGIPLIKDLPVGLNLKDHPAVFGIYINTNLTVENKSLRESFEELISTNSGKLLDVGGLLLNFVKTTLGNYTVPDVEVIYSVPTVYTSYNVMKIDSNVNEEMLDADMASKPNDIMLHFLLLHGKSTGSISLNSSNPLDFPIIDPKYLSEPEDGENLKSAIRQTLKLLETKSFKKINATLPRIPIEACTDLEDDAYWSCIVKYKTSGMYHPMGTCRMGKTKRNSVVNNKLKVHGFKNLRIVDASVIPDTTSGHLNSVVVMIAEKISDIIKKEYTR